MIRIKKNNIHIDMGVDFWVNEVFLKHLGQATKRAKKTRVVSKHLRPSIGTQTRPMPPYSIKPILIPITAHPSPKGGELVWRRRPGAASATEHRLYKLGYAEYHAANSIAAAKSSGHANLTLTGELWRAMRMRVTAHGRTPEITVDFAPCRTPVDFTESHYRWWGLTWFEERRQGYVLQKHVRAALETIAQTNAEVRQVLDADKARRQAMAQRQAAKRRAKTELQRRDAAIPEQSD